MGNEIVSLLPHRLRSFGTTTLREGSVFAKSRFPICDGLAFLGIEPDKLRFQSLPAASNRENSGYQSAVPKEGQPCP